MPCWCTEPSRLRGRPELLSLGTSCGPASWPPCCLSSGIVLVDPLPQGRTQDAAWTSAVTAMLAYEDAASADLAVPFGRSARCSAGFLARVRLKAVLSRATCEKACGKLPSWQIGRAS